jgi:hypothetical protein
MNPDMNVPPTYAGTPTQPGMPTQGQQPPMTTQPIYGPAAPVAPSQPNFAAPVDNPNMMPQQPVMQAPPVPQPMFTPMTGPLPAQPMSQPGAQPMGQPAFRPPSAGGFTPMSASQMSGSSNKKKPFIIAGIAIAVLIVVGLAVMLVTRTSLVGSLSQDSFKGINYKRPSSWEKDTSSSRSVKYHPKQSTGKASDGLTTYALRMGVHAEENIFLDAPKDMTDSYKARVQKIIDETVAKASTELLPSKYDVGCDEAPSYKDGPKRVDLPNAFMAIRYSFTCKSNSGSNSQTFYFSVLDVVPNDKNTEYVVELGAATQSIYNTNQSKINQILDSITF